MDKKIREKMMPRWVEKHLYDLGEEKGNSPTIEATILDKASEFGYEVEDEYDTHSKTEIGAFIHSVKLVKHDYAYGNNEIIYSTWVHFNHPSQEYSKRNSEWFWYIL